MEENIRQSINDICHYLALRNGAEPENGAEPSDGKAAPHCDSKKADVIMVLGSDLPQLVKAGCEVYLAGCGHHILFCGGRGHSTENLRRKIGSILKCSTGLLPDSEAELYAYLAQKMYQIPEDVILIEKNSSNTMENIKFGKNILEQSDVPHKTILLMQDPLLQRRSYVTALDFFEKESILLSYAPFIPMIDRTGKILPEYDHLWDKKRFLELLMGEIWRLRDDEHGYGPKGTGFIRHVDIPEEIEAAYRILQEAFPEYTARCQ